MVSTEVGTYFVECSGGTRKFKGSNTETYISLDFLSSFVNN
jgi:hypothetical protein